MVAATFAILFAVGALPAIEAAKASYAYHWPINPFDRQHPIRGGFGDPRTLSRDEPFGVTGPSTGGSFHFHSGIDIAAPAGTPVYPVVSGTVTIVRGDAIKVSSSERRVFQYWHLNPNVQVGQNVVAGQTVIGWIHKPFYTVHLGEIDGNHCENPLSPGHLEPYADHTTPRIVSLYAGPPGQTLKPTDGGQVSPGDQLAIDAIDETPIRVTGPFAGLPLAPALVEWRLRTGLRWGVWNVSADFIHGVPYDADFWNIYAPGTHQNVPVFDHRLYKGVAGLYLYQVHLDLTRLQPGNYELEARVADIRGNSSTKTWPLQIAAPPSG